MGKATNFAYLFAACKIDDLFEKSLPSRGVGSLLEPIWSTEQQASSAEDLEDSTNTVLSTTARRIAPIQCALEWDPRPCIKSILEKAQVQPTLDIEYSGVHDSGILAFQPFQDKNIDFSAVDVDPPVNAKDFDRCVQILKSTNRLAGIRELQVLFIGSWGWTYDDKWFLPSEELIRDCGFIVSNRHP